MKNWYWIELTGFELNSGDYNVRQFVDRTKGEIEGISLLFSNADFVNCHNGVTGKRLAPCDCSYGGHKYGGERERQNWRDVDLKNLIAELHRYGIKVLFSFFNCFTYGGDDGTMHMGDFCRRHTEIWDADKNGDPVYGINVLKRLRDGTPYEDYLFAQINRVIGDYGFDGVHLADGISTARLSVQNGDFSDDLVGQFISGKQYPVPPHTNGKSEYRKRRKYIIENLYAEYLEFLSDRWGAFYGKLYHTVKGIVVFNNAWTLDPFESLYRYGFDYNKIHAQNAYAMMVEEISATRPILCREDNAGYQSTAEDCDGYHYKYALMQMSNKINLPQVRMLPLTPIKDTVEQWDILRHNPMELHRDIVRRNHNYIFDGAFKRCMSSPFFCLSDGVSAGDWQWLSDAYKAGGDCLPQKVCGYTALYSAHRLYAELRDYILTKNYTSNELHYELLRNGLDIGCMADIPSATRLNSPLLLVNYGFLSESEKDIVKSLSVPLVVIGKTENLEGVRFGAGLDIVLRNVTPYRGFEEDVASLGKYARFRPARGRFDDMGGLWTCPLKYNRLPSKYFILLGRILSKLAGLTQPEKGVHVTKFRTGDGKYRYLISNDAHRYSLPKIRHHRKILSAESVLKYRGYGVYIENDLFIDRIPPRGIGIVEVTDGEEENESI